MSQVIICRLQHRGFDSAERERMLHGYGNMDGACMTAGMGLRQVHVARNERVDRLERRFAVPSDPFTNMR